LCIAVSQGESPAEQVANGDQWKCYGPEDEEEFGDDSIYQGGSGSISEQLLDTVADVTLGGGAESFEQQARAGDWEDTKLIEQAQQRGYQLPTTLDELDAVTEADQDAPVLGLFADGNMPVRWQRDDAEQPGYLDDPIECADNPERTADMPDLGQLTSHAIDLLSTNEDGF